MTKLTERRMAIALAQLIHVFDNYNEDPELMGRTIENARVISKMYFDNHGGVGFLPEIDGGSVDDGLMTTNADGEKVCDVYQDGIWQPHLVAVLKAECVLSETD